MAKKSVKNSKPCFEESISRVSRSEEIMQPQMLSSVPTWTIRQKTMPKFSSSESGFASINEALLAIKRLESVPGILLPGQKEILSAGHLLLEVQTDIQLPRGVTQYPGGVTFEGLMAGIRAGHYPHFTSLIPPVFGYFGADQGGLVSWDPDVREFAQYLLEDALVKNLQLELEGLGEGMTVVWPAYMSFSALEFSSEFMMNNKVILKSVQWARFRDGVVRALQNVFKQTGYRRTIHLEWKVNDPGLFDIIPTLSLAIEMARQINETVDWHAICLNNEWAHLGLAGIEFLAGTKRTIEAGLFDRLVHVNGGVIHTEKLEEWMKQPEGFHPADWPAMMDPDWPVGYGSEYIIDQQKLAIEELAKYSISTGRLVILEHDVFHFPAVVPPGSQYGVPGAVRQPFDVLMGSVKAANSMWLKAIKKAGTAA